MAPDSLKMVNDTTYIILQYRWIFKFMVKFNIHHLHFCIISYNIWNYILKGGNEEKKGQL